MEAFSYFSSLNFSSDTLSTNSSSLPPLILDNDLIHSIYENQLNFLNNSSTGSSSLTSSFTSSLSSSLSSSSSFSASSYKQDIWKSRLSTLKTDVDSFTLNFFSFLLHKYSSFPPSFLLSSLFSPLQRQRLNEGNEGNEENIIFLDNLKENSIDFRGGILHQPSPVQPVR